MLQTSLLCDAKRTCLRCKEALFAKALLYAFCFLKTYNIGGLQKRSNSATDIAADGIR